MAPVIRRQPLLKRIKAYLDPVDFFLWISEELNSSDWSEFERRWALPIGVGLNLVFILARAANRPSQSDYDDVFAEPTAKSWGISWMVRILVVILIFRGVS